MSAWTLELGEAGGEAFRIASVTEAGIAKPRSGLLVLGLDEELLEGLGRVDVVKVYLTCSGKGELLPPWLV